MSENLIFENRLHILGKITATLLHEIRNPLSVVKLSMDYLNMHRDELSEDLIGTIENSSQALFRIQALVDNLLFFSRPNTREEKLCSINQISDYAFDIVEVDASRKNIAMFREYSGKNIPFVKCDANKLLQIFLNILTNAVDACNNGDKIIIRVYSDPANNITWEVEDTGIGISEEDQKAIFSDFFTKKVKGTGLGLSICKSLATELNAEINFESQLGKGTKFTLLFNSNFAVKENEI
ncbi:MAG: HAMP domain-containing sensor histidine kinase [Ignavibacteria bacterium]|nr:HAMP domain-containing sensor histidine kinase [Ignavibacteria bacterium]